MVWFNDKKIIGGALAVSLIGIASVAQAQQSDQFHLFKRSSQTTPQPPPPPPPPPPVAAAPVEEAPPSPAPAVEQFRLFGSRTASPPPPPPPPAVVETASAQASQNPAPATEQFRLFGSRTASPPPPPPPPPPPVAAPAADGTVQEFRLFGNRNRTAPVTPTAAEPAAPTQPAIEVPAPQEPAPQEPVPQEPVPQEPVPQWLIPQVETAAPAPPTEVQPETPPIDITPPTEPAPEPAPVPEQVAPTPTETTPVFEVPPAIEAPPVAPPAPVVEAPPVMEVPPAPVAHNMALHDESEELLGVDRFLADNIYANGPLSGYSGAISSEGVLYDASGGSPAGIEAAQSRFGAFPEGFTLERRPERAMASGGAGSSWGGYSLKRGNVIMSDGRYVAIWRKENGVWKIVTELAAGRSQAPTALPPRPAAPRPAAQTGPGGLPVMRDALGRPVAGVGPRVDPTAAQPAPN